MQLVLLVALGGLMHAVRLFAPDPLEGGPTGTALALGYLLLSGLLAGHLFKQLNLPRLTGYLAAGLVAGPEVLDLVSPAMLENLRIANGLAISLIALTAGTELEVKKLRPLYRSIFWISIAGVLGTMVLLGAVTYLARGFLPFLASRSDVQALALAAVLGVTMAAQSPAVVVALRNETGADGPVARTALGVVVVADLMVIIAFATVSSIAKTAFGAGTEAMDTLRTLAWELGGSVVAGGAVGLLLVLFLRKVERGVALFVVVVCFVIAEVGQRLHLDPLIVSLAAGALVENATRYGERLRHGIEASLPVYIVFFAVAGASVHVHALRTIGIPAACFVVVRGLGLLTGARLGAGLARAPETVRRFAGYGLLPQAGLALALALLFQRTFPVAGADAAALVFAVVAINELAAPIAYRWALIRSGEAARTTIGPPQPTDAAGQALLAPPVDLHESGT